MWCYDLVRCMIDFCIMWYDAMPCYVIVCYVMLHYIILYYVYYTIWNYIISGQIIRISVCWDFEPLKVGSIPYRLGRY